MLFLSRAASFAVMSLVMIGLTSMSSPSRASLNPSAASPTSTVAQTQLPEPPQNVPLLQPVPAVTPIQPVAADLPSAPAAPDSTEPSYATLAAAVAAQAVSDAASEDLRCLAVTIYHEAKGEPLAGQLAVANVVINRSNSGRFPKTVCSVVTQPGQFSFVRGGKLPEVDASRPAYRTALAVAQVALKEKWQSPAPAALYFHARSRNAGWGRPQVAAIGNQVFYR